MSKKKPTYDDVSKGDRLVFGGREWRVVKLERKGKKKARVMLERKGQYAEDVVRLDDRVEFAAENKKDKLHDRSGAQTRWATDKEAEKAGVGLRAGDSRQTTPPAPAEGDVWETPHGRVERMLGDLMAARLVAETKDESAGYYVPPVDASTVASHLVVFHDGIPEACEDETAMLRAHDAQHAAATIGAGVLSRNHWHTEKRP